MADLKVSFTLGERDLKHFRRVMAKAIDVANTEKEQEITAAAVALIEKARAVDPPDYVRERLDRLERIVAMSYDDEWRIPEPVKRRVLAALSYLTEHDDIIPDSVPGLGFLDDAIMIELVSHELQHELDGYQAFCDFRQREDRRVFHPQGRITRDRAVAKKRKELRARIGQREKAGPAEKKRRFRLW
ncbi:MAG TPA: YkvA family protein [Myxococcota bacterium]|nr:YkvA family protein [Myxococcota bacterium]